MKKRDMSVAFMQKALHLSTKYRNKLFHFHTPFGIPQTLQYVLGKSLVSVSTAPILFIPCWQLLICKSFYNLVRITVFATTKKIVFLHYQTLHFFRGCIRLPRGHLKACAKSCELERGPRTLIGPGLCTDDLILFNASSGRMVPHQICA